MRNIPLARPFIEEPELESVRETFESGWVAQGPKVKAFEEKVAHYSGAKYGVTVNSCTSGLYLSLLAYGISRGDKVIVPDFTFWSTGNVVKYVGAEPEIVDIDPGSFCIDVDQVEERINEDVKAIMPVHTFGHPAELQKLQRIAEQNNIPLIEDSASALGSEDLGRRIGSSGNLCCFSFQGRKIVTTGEGGMIVLNDPDFARGLREKVRERSYRMSDIQAAVGLVQMDRVEQFIERRIQIAELYRDLIEDYRLPVILPSVRVGCRHPYQAYVVLVDDRDKVIKELQERGIESTIGTYSLTSSPRFKGNCPKGAYAYKHSLALPMYHDLTLHVNNVVDALKEALR